MSTTVTGPFGTLRVERATMTVAANAPTPDRSWRHVDANGHEHRWNDGWPTLRWVVDDTYYCESCNDTHAEGHWECALCGEHVTPGMRTDPFPRVVPVSTDYYLNDERITEAEARALLEEDDR